jgi:hypothetical protein
MPLVVDVTSDENGILSVSNEDRFTCKGTMKGIITMLMLMQTIPFLIDRLYLVYVRFGGVIETTPESFPENFYCEGPLLGVTFCNRVGHKVCPDGAYRTPVTNLRIVAGGGGPLFDMHAPAPVTVGRNLLKVQIAVIPVGCTAPKRQSGSSG